MKYQQFLFLIFICFTFEFRSPRFMRKLQADNSEMPGSTNLKTRKRKQQILGHLKLNPQQQLSL